MNDKVRQLKMSIQPTACTLLLGDKKKGEQKKQIKIMFLNIEL